jgi:hypothetical protein
MNLTEIARRTDIRDVWGALGGAELRGTRGRAWWRSGDGFSVSLDARRSLWYDFVAGEGGDVIALVQRVRECDFKAAAAWLADYAGVAAVEDRRPADRTAAQDWRTDLEWAAWWGRAAEMLAEDALAALPSWHAARALLTALLATIRLGDASLVAEYRASRKRHPELTRAIALAGQRSDARLQRKLAQWIRETL